MIYSLRTIVNDLQLIYSLGHDDNVRSFLVANVGLVGISGCEIRHGQGIMMLKVVVVMADVGGKWRFKVTLLLSPFYNECRLRFSHTY